MVRLNLNDLKIDIVIPWVDGADPAWIEKKRRYKSASKNFENKEDESQRYRDWGTLKFLLRSIEMFCPWVNNVFLLTDNQKPVWINTNKIKIIDHEQFIPKKYLPTFNSNVIEMNVANIDELSNHFILLNDDFLFVNKVSPEDFFTNDGRTVDVMSQSILMPRDEFSHIAVNNISLINQKFDKHKWLRHNWKDALSFKNGFATNIMSLLLSPLPYITRFYDPHIGVAYTKDSFKQVIQAYPNSYYTLMNNKFRNITDISHWLVRYYQIMNGKVAPHSYKFGHYLTISQSDQLHKFLIKSGKTKMIVLNDKVENDADKKNAENSLSELMMKFPQKSIFEK